VYSRINSDEVERAKVSSESHEPCAIKGGQVEKYRPSLDLWECRSCHSPIGVACGHIPLTCPICGVHFTQLLIDGEYKTPSEFGL